MAKPKKSTLQLAIANASSAELEASLTHLAGALASSDTPAPLVELLFPHYEAYKEEIEGELARREVANNIDISLSSFATKLMADFLYIGLARIKGCPQYPGHNNRARIGFIANDKNSFAADAYIGGKGGATRGAHYDDVLLRLHSALAQKMSKNKKNKFPVSIPVDDNVTTQAERIQRVILFANLTGGSASFQFHLNDRAYRGKFNGTGFAISSGIKDAKKNLEVAVVMFEKLAGLATLPT